MGPSRLAYTIRNDDRWQKKRSAFPSRHGHPPALKITATFQMKSWIRFGQITLHLDLLASLSDSLASFHSLPQWHITSDGEESEYFWRYCLLRASGGCLGAKFDCCEGDVNLISLADIATHSTPPNAADDFSPTTRLRKICQPPSINGRRIASSYASPRSPCYAIS